QGNSGQGRQTVVCVGFAMHKPCVCVWRRSATFFPTTNLPSLPIFTGGHFRMRDGGRRILQPLEGCAISYFVHLTYLERWPSRPYAILLATLGSALPMGNHLLICCCFQAVTAPSDAERTVRAYLASTPRETRGSGRAQPALRRDHSASARSTDTVLASAS